MNVNAQKLKTLMEKGDKRLDKLIAAPEHERIPRPTMLGNARGAVPSLHHAALYKKALRFRLEDWLVAPKVPS